MNITKVEGLPLAPLGYKFVLVNERNGNWVKLVHTVHEDATGAVWRPTSLNDYHIAQAARICIETFEVKQREEQLKAGPLTLEWTSNK